MYDCCTCTHVRVRCSRELYNYSVQRCTRTHWLFFLGLFNKSCLEGTCTVLYTYSWTRLSVVRSYGSTEVRRYLRTNVLSRVRKYFRTTYTTRNGWPYVHNQYCTSGSTSVALVRVVLLPEIDTKIYFRTSYSFVPYFRKYHSVVVVLPEVSYQFRK